MRILRYALTNIVRNSFLSFSTVVTLGLIVFFIHILFFLEAAAGALIDSVNDRVTISVNLRPGYDETNSEVIELMAAVRGIPGVELEYVSKEAAFAILEERYPDLAGIVEDDEENPLPSSLLVKNISLEYYDRLDETVGRYRGIIIYDEDPTRQSLVDYRAQYEKIRDFIGVVSAVQYAIYAIIGFFLFGIFVIVYTIIGNFVFFYREEIRITRLVGGDSHFIYGPFLIQGAIYTLVSALVSALVFLGLLGFVDIGVFVDFSDFADAFIAEYMPVLALVTAGITLVGAMSGYISSSRFVREAGRVA